MDRNYAYHIVIGINCLIRRFRHCLYNNYDMLEDNKTMEIVYKDFLKFIVQPCTTSSNRPSCYIDVMLLNNNYNPYLRVDIVTAQLIDINHLNEDIETKKDSLPIGKWEEILYLDLKNTLDNLTLELYRSIGIDEIRLDRVSRFSEYDRMFKHINSQLKYLRETYPYEYGNGFLTDEVVSLPSLKIFSNGYMDYTSFNKKTNMTRTIGVRLHELSVWHIASISDLESLDYLLENVDDILKKYEDKIRPKTKEIVI